MDKSLLFLPFPRKLIRKTGLLHLENRCVIQIFSPEAGKLLFTAERFQAVLKRATNLDWPIHAGNAVPTELIGLTLEIDPGYGTGEQGYVLQIDSSRIRIVSQAEVGIFYGVCTLIQILGQCGPDLPCLEIEDAPDFQARGVMLDISRDKVPSMATLYELVDRLASWKINQLQLYTEHTFAYLNHPTVWRDASPLTGQEILELDAYCRQRFIELVPNQNSFGHMERWLKLPDYAALAEIHGEFDAPWGKVQGPFSLSPANPGSLRLVKSLYDELLPHFSSRMVNVGCDETFDIGVGQSREMCAARGTDRVMLDYLLELCHDVTARGFTMQYWADILVHHPNLLPEAPKDAVALIWNYEANQSFEEDAARFAQAGLPFYVCPGTSSWNSLGGRMQNALANTLDAARSGIAHGAMGYLNTDWGDNGHWQTLPISLPGFEAGAAYSWCVDSNQNCPLESCLNLFGFEDNSGVSGRAMMKLGDVYRLTGLDLPNSSALFWILQHPLNVLRGLGTIGDGQLKTCLSEIEGVIEEIGNAKINRQDADLILREIHLTARMMRHACLRGLLMNEQDPTAQTRLAANLKADIVDWLEEYRRIWLERNRPGGLRDSVQKLDLLLEEYRELEKR